MWVRWMACGRWAVMLVAFAIAMIILTIQLYGHQLTETNQKPNQSLAEEQIQEAIRQARENNAKRLLRVQTVCQKYNLGLYRDSSAPPAFKQPPTPQYEVFYIDLIHKLSWCPVYKAASSSWLYNLCLLGGYDKNELDESKRTQQLSSLARKVFPVLEYPQAEEALQSTLRLLVVRHPFERLLSAYRDKLENTQMGTEHGTGHFYRKYGSRIVAKYRLGGNSTRTQELLRPGTYFWAKGQPEPSGVEPTFQEFVRYLIDVDLLNYADDHWIPVYLFCTPCLLQYNIIAKVETLQRDQIYALKAAKIDHLVQPEWQHRSSPDATKASNIAKMYFSQLSIAEVQKLYQKYQLDFELFGYEINDYLKYTYETNTAL